MKTLIISAMFFLISVTGSVAYAAPAERGSVKWCDAKLELISRAENEGKDQATDKKKVKLLKADVTADLTKHAEQYQQYCQ